MKSFHCSSIFLCYLDVDFQTKNSFIIKLKEIQFWKIINACKRCYCQINLQEYVVAFVKVMGGCFGYPWPSKL